MKPSMTLTIKGFFFSSTSLETSIKKTIKTLEIRNHSIFNPGICRKVISVVDIQNTLDESQILISFFY